MTVRATFLTEQRNENRKPTNKNPYKYTILSPPFPYLRAILSPSFFSYIEKNSKEIFLEIEGISRYLSERNCLKVIEKTVIHTFFSGTVRQVH